MTQSLKIIVIGAGICGLSSAIWLRRAGHEVTLIDRDHPGAGASYGNAGLLAQWAMVPVNTPDLPKTALKYLLNPKSPLFLQWSALPKLTPWLFQFLRHATESGTAHMAAGINRIVSDAADQHRALTRGTRAERWITDSHMAFAYPSRAKFEADRYGWGLRAQFGQVPEVIEGPAVQEAEPILSPYYSCLALLKGHAHILNPGAYMADLARVLEDEGGRYLRAEARDVQMERGQITGIVTGSGLLPCDHAVLAAGIWSKPLMRKLGLKVPLVTERGHHLQFTNPSMLPRNPIMISKGKFVATPMETGLRCAGTVELGDTKKGPNRKVLGLIRDYAKEAFPELRHDNVEEWLGFRPSTPDSLPLIGEIGNTGVHAAFGHQHIGLTAGPKTGRIVAALIDKQPPNMDLSAYDANRFART